MIQKMLNNIGLNKNEVTVYAILLESGELAPPKVAELSGLSRQNSYTVLKTLVKKELVEQVDKKKKLTYIPLPPGKLLEYIGSYKEGIVRTEREIQANIAHINSQYNLAMNKPGISYFEGSDGLRKIFTDIYGPGKTEVYGAANIDLIDKNLGGILGELIPKRKDNKIFAKSILADSTTARALKINDKTQLRETILADPKEYPLSAEIDVYDNKIALMDFSKGSFVGVLIENKSMAETLASIFKMAFEVKSKKPKQLHK